MTTQTNNTKKTQPRVLRGVVVSSNMQDTIVVAVERYVKHPKYQKFIKSTKRYSVHDKGNTSEIGSQVEIVECKPISKTKRFTLLTAAEKTS